MYICKFMFGYELQGIPIVFFHGARNEWEAYHRLSANAVEGLIASWERKSTVSMELWHLGTIIGKHGKRWEYPIDMIEMEVSVWKNRKINDKWKFLARKTIYN
jgi:hypothetical protein